MIKKIKNNNKGFTLIELLAVIVILGVLMIIAIPMVSQYIRDAKRNAMVDLAKNYVNSARYAYLNGDYSNSGDDAGKCTGVVEGKIYIKFSQIPMDGKSTGSGDNDTKVVKSPIKGTIDLEKSYVLIHTTETGHYTYSVAMADSVGNGFGKSAAIEVEKLTKKSVTTGQNPITLPSEATNCIYSGGDDVGL